ncbi:Imm26 family immunity protein [Flavobacterium sp. MMS24-S5]|uniref:Imm26 family immunity protein n=1 Tax=Flavobacterium sp. MMS24-S5 TaxID=3416605 RepID=UPI003D08046A
MKIKAGILFCIALFMNRDDWKLKIKLSEDDLNKDFAFGRVIETSSSVLVEIFKKTGSAKTDINEIINSGIMFSPVQIFWDGIVKKRWKIIGQTENYDKIKDSNYNNLKMVFGIDDDFRLRDLHTEQETIISRNQIEKHEFSTVWFPINLENRILKKMDYL